MTSKKLERSPRTWLVCIEVMDFRCRLSGSGLAGRRWLGVHRKSSQICPLYGDCSAMMNESWCMHMTDTVPYANSRLKELMKLPQETLAKGGSPRYKRWKPDLIRPE